MHTYIHNILHTRPTPLASYLVLSVSVCLSVSRLVDELVSWLVGYSVRHLVVSQLVSSIRLMDKILHDPKDSKLWELWYIPYYGSCRILSINGS